MVEKLTEGNRKELLRLFSSGGVRNLFFINNLNNYTIGQEIEVYRIGDIYIMNWRCTSLVIVKGGDNYPVDEIKAFLKTIFFRVVNGESSVLKPLEDFFKDRFEIKYKELMYLTKANFNKVENRNHNLQELFSPDDWELLYDLYTRCPEYNDIEYDEDKEAWSLAKAEEEYPSTGVILKSKNQAVAGAYLAGATKEMAMIVGVAVEPDWRGGGLGTAVVSELCDIALNENNIKTLALNYSNDISKHIYEKLGFKRECDYAFFKFRRNK